MSSRLTSRIGVWVSGLAVLYLVIPHVLFWFTGTLADGNHVAKDFHETGMALSAGDRVLGLVIAGLPVLFFSFSLVHLSRFFHGISQGLDFGREPADVLVRSARSALTGAVLLFLYPTVLSLGFFLTQPPQHRTVIVSLQPEVRILLLVGLLFLLGANGVQKRVTDEPSVGRRSIFHRRAAHTSAGWSRGHR